MPPVVEFTTIAEMFERITLKYLTDDRPVMMHKIDGSYRSIRYAELRSMVDRFAYGLAALGVARGDTIALISENRPEWVVADMGMMRIGAVNVSLYPTLTPRQIEFIMNDAGITLAIVSNTLQLNKVLKIRDTVRSLKRIVMLSERGSAGDPMVMKLTDLLAAGDEFERRHPGFLGGELKNTSPDDLLTIIYTSGTTGNPKGVMLTHANLASNIISSASCVPFTPEDRVLSFLPLSHSYERMAGYYTALACGVTIAYAESIDTVGQNLLEVRPTVVTTVPRPLERIHGHIMKQINRGPAYRRSIFHWAVQAGMEAVERKKSGRLTPWLAAKRAVADLLVFRKLRSRLGGRIKFFVSGAAALEARLGLFFEAIGITVLEGYGMTETSPVISLNRLEEHKFGTVGKALPGVSVRLAEDGEILVRGPNVMRGYWNDDKSTEEVLDGDGWLHTGDIGVFDEEGFLVITDRKKNLFVSSGGKNIAPQPIENLFLKSHFIDQFVLIGDGRMFLSALVVPNFSLLEEYAREHAIAYSSAEELANMPEINAMMEREMEKLQQDLANYERVRKFTILGRPLTLENGEITPTMKVRRRVVEERFKPLIEKMYEGIG